MSNWMKDTDFTKAVDERKVTKIPLPMDMISRVEPWYLNSVTWEVTLTSGEVKSVMNFKNVRTGHESALWIGQKTAWQLIRYLDLVSVRFPKNTKTSLDNDIKKLKTEQKEEGLANIQKLVNTICTKPNKEVLVVDLIVKNYMGKLSIKFPKKDEINVSKALFPDV